jgi:hypothetical protein
MNQDKIKEYAENFIDWGHGAWGSQPRFTKTERELLYLEIMTMLLVKIRDAQETKPETK